MVTSTQLSDDGGADIDEWAYGIEGTYDVGANAVLFSSLTTGTVDAGGASDIDTFNWDIGGNFYVSPNIRDGGYFGTGNLDAGGGDIDTTSYGLNAEFQPWAAPVSLTLGYNHVEIEDIDGEAHALQVGARWNFGGGTIRDRDNATPFDTNTGYVNRLYGIW